MGMNLKSIGSKVRQAATKAHEAAKKEVRAMPTVGVRVQTGDTFVAGEAGPGLLRFRTHESALDVFGPKGTGGSYRLEGHELGVHLKANEGPATLGVIDVEFAGLEIATGVVPAAPVPLPMGVYAGKDRDGEG